MKGSLKNNLFGFSACGCLLLVLVLSVTFFIFIPAFGTVSPSAYATLIHVRRGGD